MRNHYIFLMIFALFCITLVSGHAGYPADISAGADNSPAKVDDAVKRISSDRRFIYPEGSLDNPFNSKDMLDMLERLERLSRDNEAPVEPPSAGSGNRGGSFFGGWGLGDIAFDVAFLVYIFYSVAMLVLAFVIYRLVLFYYPGFGRATGDSRNAAAESHESLDPSGRISEAKRLMREGRWPEALSALVMALLLTLDSKQLIRYHRSRTSREYLYGLKRHPLLFTIAREFVTGFEEMRYGNRVPDEAGVYYMLDLLLEAEKAMPSEKSQVNAH